MTVHQLLDHEPSVELLAVQNPNPGHCRACGVEVKHPRQYCDEHRPASKPKKSERKRGERLAPEQVKDSAPLREAIRDISETKVGKKPTVDATSKILGKVVYYLFLAIVMTVVSSDMTLTEDEQEQTSGALALSSEDAEAIARPFARFLTPTSFWQKTGPQIIANGDIIDALIAGYNAASGLMHYQRDRKRRELQNEQRRLGNPAMNGHVPFVPPQPAPERMVATVPAREGIQIGIPPSADVISHEMIMEIRRRNEQPEE